MLLLSLTALLLQEQGPKLPPPPDPKSGEPTAPLRAPAEEQRPAVRGQAIDRKIELSPKAQHFIRTLALVAIPDKFENDKKWGGTKKVQSGVSVKFKDGKLRTHRKWKNVKHGRWQKYHAKLIDPDERFQLRISNVVKSEAGPYHFDIDCIARLRIEGRWQDWRLGVPMLRISTEALTDVRLAAHCELDMEFDYSVFPPSVQLSPKVHTADIKIGRFEIRRISHLKGRVAEEFSGAIKSILTKEIANRRKDLPKKLNKKISKKKDDLKISAGEWLKFSSDKTAKSDAIDQPKKKQTASNSSGSDKK